MDFGKAFSYVFDDPNWLKKMLYGIIPIANIGYGLETARNVQNGLERPMPEWEGRIGEFFVKGFKAIVVYIVWLLPLLILMGIGASMSFGSMIAAGAMSDAGSNAAGAAAAAGGFGGFCLIGLGIIAGIVLIIPTYISLARLANGGQIGDALKFGEIFGEARATWKSWLPVFGVYFVVNFLINIISQFTAGIGGLLLGGYGQVVFGHAMGQVLRKQRGVTDIPYPTITPPTQTF